MKRILALCKKLSAATGDAYEVNCWGRGDWSLYCNGVEEINTLSADAMAGYIRAVLANLAK